MAAGCTASYVPLPLDLDGPLPADAFERCAAVVSRCYGALIEVDAEQFRLQSDWAPVPEEASERRASVFRDAGRADSLGVVVERRRLTVPVFGAPHWTSPRGDDAAERELAELLLEALRITTPMDSPPTVPLSKRP